MIEEAERRFRKELAEELRLKEQLRARIEKEAGLMKEFDESATGAAWFVQGVRDFKKRIAWHERV